MNEQDVFLGLGVEIKFPPSPHKNEPNFDQAEYERASFLKIIETLTRIGVASKQDKTLYQSVHLLHKRGRYALMHFKEMFVLDGKSTDFTEEDKGRRNSIANLLADWNLVVLVDPTKTEKPITPLNRTKVISYAEKPEWKLVSKYTIGNRKQQNGDHHDNSRNL
jgi:Bacteriophage translational regulator